MSVRDHCRDDPASEQFGIAMSAGSPIDWNAVRVAYESEQETIRSVADRFDVAVHAINYRAKKHNWRRRRRKRDTGDTNPQRVLVQRLYRTIDRKLAQLETRMQNDNDDLTIADHERETRALGQLIRNFEKVSGLEADQIDKAKDARGANSEDEADAASIDPERLRNELAERILRLREKQRSDPE
ncbi:MAG: hypothetical protein ACR2PA_06210 [Hyphomicrobiaceae bacterium]